MTKAPPKQAAPGYRAQLRWQPIAVLLIIAMIWGSNMAFVKLAMQDITPLFMAGIRSLVAAACLCIWMKAKGLALFPSGIILVSRYPVSLLHAFSFFTPVFGVIISGVLILGEAISPNLIVALIMVSLGMVFVNYKPRK